MLEQDQKGLALEEVHEQLAEAQCQAEESHDKYLRLAAEMENTRKRIERNAKAGALREKRGFLAHLLDITDDLERALAYADGSGQGLREGVELTMQNMLRLLASDGVEPLPVEPGQPFDPHEHEAVEMRTGGGEGEPVILEVVRTGYRHGDDLLRPAQVIVRPGE